MSRRPRDAVVGLVGVAMAAMVLTGCHTAPRLGVPTTVYPVDGHCDTSAVVEVGASLPLSGSDSVAGRAQLLGLELGVNGSTPPEASSRPIGVWNCSTRTIAPIPQSTTRPCWTW